MAYMGRLCPKGVLFLGFRYTKGKGFHKLKHMKGKGNLSFRYLKGPLIKIFRVDNNMVFWLTPLPVILLISFINCIPRVSKRDTVFLSKYVKRVPFFNGSYTKGVPFLSKMGYKRVRGWT